MIVSVAAIKKYCEELGKLGTTVNSSRVNILGKYDQSQSYYSAQLQYAEEILHKVTSELSEAESDARRANDMAASLSRQSAYSDDENASSLLSEMSFVESQRIAASEKAAVCSAKLNELRPLIEELRNANSDLQELLNLCNDFDAEYASFSRFSKIGVEALNSFCVDISKIEENLESDNSSHNYFESPGENYSSFETQNAYRQPASKSNTVELNSGNKEKSDSDNGPKNWKSYGWCSDNCFSSMYLNSSGEKMLKLSIGGKETNISCSKMKIADAYRLAKSSNDAEMIKRLYAIFEIETLREDLELGEGEEGIAQIGGYHGAVKENDPENYESHHIPARSVQKRNADRLPSLALTKEDHKLTDSYAAKQSKKYNPSLPSNIPRDSYKESVEKKIEAGEFGYVEVVRNELLGLRKNTGHKYDKGISAYLDAVIDMIATEGIPKDF